MLLPQSFGGATWVFNLSVRIVDLKLGLDRKLTAFDTTAKNRLSVVNRTYREVRIASILLT